MHCYWRIQQDLDSLGEIIRFHDPSLARSFRQWIRRNLMGLCLAEGMDWEKLIRPGLN